MPTKRRLAALLLGLVAGGSPTAGVLPSANAASPKHCGNVLDTGNLSIVRVHATGTTCRIGRSVARSYEQRQQRGAQSAIDVEGRRWRCRIRQAATGTDPGYIAQTKISCGRGRTVTTFALRS